MIHDDYLCLVDFDKQQINEMFLNGSFVNSVSDGLDFTLKVPLCLIEDIFSLVDVCSLCSAAQVSKRWNNIINNSDYIWKSFLIPLQGKDADNSGLSYKMIVKKQYNVHRKKQNWLFGKFSFINSFQEQQNLKPICNFSKNDWGDILQRELER